MNQAMMDEAERRRYFRIDDHLALKYRVLNREQLAAALSRLQIGYPDRLSLASAFATNSSRMKVAMDRFKREMPDVSTYLEGLNEKLDLLIQLLAASENELEDQPTHEVSLSASGISFVTHEPVAVGSNLELKLLVFPTYVCVLAFGTVVHCDGSDVEGAPPSYTIGVDFTHIRENDRELIIQHVTRKQSAMLREAKTALDD